MLFFPLAAVTPLALVGQGLCARCAIVVHRHPHHPGRVSVVLPPWTTCWAAPRFHSAIRRGRVTPARTLS